MADSWSAADVLAFFYKQPELIDKQQVLLHKEKFSRALKSPEIFCEVMSLITPKQRDVIFELLFPDIISNISCVNDFVKIALFLTPAQKKILWENTPPLKINSLLELAKLLNLLEPACYPALIQSAGALQKTGLEFGMLLGMLNPKQRAALAAWIKQSIPELIILSSEDFQSAMQYLNDTQRKLLFDRVWLTLPGMIQNSHGFKRIFSCLSATQSSLLLLSIDLEKICFNTIDKVEVLTSIHKNQLKRLYISFQENAFQWGVILGSLEPDKATIILGKFPKALYNGKSFSELMILNSPQVRIHLFDLFKQKFSLFIKNVDDMVQCFNYLDGGQKDYLWQRFAREIPGWIKQPAFFRLFANEHPDLFEFFQQQPNCLDFVVAMLSEKPELIKSQFENLFKLPPKFNQQFFQASNDPRTILNTLELLHPRRAAILNQALHLCLNKIDLLSSEAFMDALSRQMPLDQQRPKSQF